MGYPDNTRRVTEDNIQEVAAWCGGTVSRTFGSTPIIKITNFDIAVIGDYIVKGSNGVFSPFSPRNYERFPGKARTDPDKFSAILRFVKIAMDEQVKCINGTNTISMEEVAQNLALRILELG